MIDSEQACNSFMVCYSPAAKNTLQEGMQYDGNKTSSGFE